MLGRSVSSACLLRQVSSGLSRDCKNERRPDADEAWFVAVNFMAGNCMAHRYRLSGKDGDGEKKVAALLVDVLVDAGVERAYGIWSSEFRELPAFCGIGLKRMIGKYSAWNMSP